MRNIVIVICILHFCILNNPVTLNAQKVIKMHKSGGVSVIDCKVNGYPLSFIFDTGASDVTISEKTAIELAKGGYLTNEDIIGKSSYQVASGDIVDGLVINLKKIEISGIELTNIRASVLFGESVPLLLGQSAISRLGTIQLNLNYNTIELGLNVNNNFIPSTPSSGLSRNYIGVVIGKQEWMADNLDVTTFRNGDKIPEAKTYEEWTRAAREKKPAWCYMWNNPSTGKQGKLYNWYAVSDPRGLAPLGWRVSTSSDWNILEFHLKSKFSKPTFGDIARELDQLNFSFRTIGVRVAVKFQEIINDFDDKGPLNNAWWLGDKSSSAYAPDVSIHPRSMNRFFISTERLKVCGQPVKCIRE